MTDKKGIFSDCYKLDHGGIIYPYIAKNGWNQVFRLEATLDENVDVQSVVAALENLQKEFPSFFVALENRKRFYLLKKIQDLPEIVPETKLCRQFDLENQDHPLFRITYKGKRIGIELFHSVADGNGAIIFFFNLIAEYYTVRGFDIPRDDQIFHHGMRYEHKDTENSFFKVFQQQGGKTASRAEKPAYQYNDMVQDSDLRLTVFSMPANLFKTTAKMYEATVTEFIAAIYTKALCMCAQDEQSENDVKIEIPLDLRRRFSSATLRNFSLYFITSVPKEYANLDLSAIIEILHEQFVKGADTAKLRNDIYTNVSQAEMPLFRMLPTKLKKAVLKIGNSLYGERLLTSPLSNLGVVKLPPELSAHVENLGFIIGRTLKNTLYSGVVTYNGTLYWDLSCVVESRKVEDRILKILRDLNLDPGVTVRE